jgi:hypothetical protein
MGGGRRNALRHMTAARACAVAMPPAMSSLSSVVSYLRFYFQLSAPQPSQIHMRCVLLWICCACRLTNGRFILELQWYVSCLVTARVPSVCFVFFRIECHTTSTRLMAPAGSPGPASLNLKRSG